MSGRDKRRADRVAAAQGSPLASLAPPLLLALLSFLLYANSLHAPFVFDDQLHIVDNPDIGDFRAFAARSNRPLVALSLTLNFQLGGADPFGYHLVDVFLHALCAVLVYLLVRGMGKGGDFFAFLVALGFVAHPVQTEAVSYTISRSEILASLFYCASLLALARALVAERPGGRRSWTAAAAVGAGLALASKEIAVTIPVAGFLYDAAFVSGSAGRAWRKNRLLYAALCSSWLVGAWLLVTRTYTGAGPKLAGVDSWRYLATQTGVVLRYLRLVAVPVGLCLDYDWPWAASLLEPAVLGRGALLVVLAGSGCWLLKRIPEVGFGILWFFVLLTPTSSVLPIADPIFEHRLYLAMVGPLLCALFAGRALLASFGRKALLAGAALWLVVVCLFGVLTVERNRLWSDPVLLWQDTVAKAPGKGRPHLQLGQAYVERRMTEQAEREFRLAAAGRYDERGRAKALNNLAGLLIGRGRCSQARPLLRRALAYYPDLAVAHYGLALCQVERSRKLVASGRIEEAKRVVGSAAHRLKRALALDPAEPRIRYFLARLLAALGQPREAREHWAWLARRMPHTEEGKKALAALAGKSEDFRPGP